MRKFILSLGANHAILKKQELLLIKHDEYLFLVLTDFQNCRCFRKLNCHRTFFQTNCPSKKLCYFENYEMIRNSIQKATCPLVIHRPIRQILQKVSSLLSLSYFFCSLGSAKEQLLYGMLENRHPFSEHIKYGRKIAKEEKKSHASSFTFVGLLPCLL